MMKMSQRWWNTVTHTPRRTLPGRRGTTWRKVGGFLFFPPLQLWFLYNSGPFCLSFSGGHLRLRSRQGGRAVVPGGRHHLRDQEEWRRVVRGRDERDHRAIPWQLRGVHHALCRLMKPLPTLGGQQAFDGAKRSKWRSKTVETVLVGGGESLNEVRLDMKTKHDHYIRSKLHVTLLWFFWLDLFMKTLRCLSFFFWPVCQKTVFIWFCSGINGLPEGLHV